MGGSTHGASYKRNTNTQRPRFPPPLSLPYPPPSAGRRTPPAAPPAAYTTQGSSPNCRARRSRSRGRRRTRARRTPRSRGPVLGGGGLRVVWGGWGVGGGVTTSMLVWLARPSTPSTYTFKAYPAQKDGRAARRGGQRLAGVLPPGGVAGEHGRVQLHGADGACGFVGGIVFCVSGAI